jgi:hypothetical protein
MTSTLCIADTTREILISTVYRQVKRGGIIVSLHLDYHGGSTLLILCFFHASLIELVPVLHELQIHL